MDAFLAPPPPLTPLQRRVFWIVTAAVAATRVFALSKTMWDWDEAQFASGVRDLNVGNPYHHPHPPGFPVFMALAKLVRLVAPTDFAALQTVVFVAACALFPLAFVLARELRFPFATSVMAALLFAFLPNVWFYGGTGFSDIPGVAFTIAAAAMLLRGCRDPRAYLAGALLLGLAAGMRPQAVMLGAAPFAVASWMQFRQSWRRVAGACALIAATVGIAYAIVPIASGSIEGYVISLRGVGEWVRTKDAYTAAERPPLNTLLDEYFVRPMGAGRLGIVVTIFAALGALRGLRREGPRIGLAILTFLPFAVFAYLSLDYHSIHRYSTAYLLLWTLLAAHALSPCTTRRWPVAGQVALLALMVARYMQWTGVMLMEVRSTPSPTFAAATLARRLVPPGRRIWIDPSMQPWAEYYLADRAYRYPLDESELLREGRSGEYFLVEGAARGEETHAFIRPTGRIWDVARQRYFAASVVPVSNFWQFGDGWYDEEQHEGRAWRWMGARSRVIIPPGTGRARLRLTLEPQDLVKPVVEVFVNGGLVDRFTLPDRLTKQWTVPSRADGQNVLEIRSSTVMNPKKLGVSDDTRDLSLRLYSYGWQPLRSLRE